MIVITEIGKANMVQFIIQLIYKPIYLYIKNGNAFEFEEVAMVCRPTPYVDSK